ncbi:MAG: hypothetical protein F6K40_29225 [Okeania sp. SIO3I5]|uniref:hypothetical protein n=1 Tax=Okeania sp. SIO3I5 TaxID=2607805 RepID=UPI0013B99270|nr:hypothetical protein [Okeania sp. SIO3I5]NEQ40101.1 hypothetical protein [Okeania sp. SIO3I5]
MKPNKTYNSESGRGNARRQSNIQDFFPGAMPEKFSSCGASIDGCFFLIKFFHPSQLREKSLTFLFFEAPEKSSALDILSGLKAWRFPSINQTD